MRGAWVALMMSGALGGCKSYEDQVRDDFSRSYTCPAHSIAIEGRTDLDASLLEFGPPPAPPAEVAKDPERRALWTQQHPPPVSRRVPFRAEGCGHEAYYLCRRIRSKPSCVVASYAPKQPFTLERLRTLDLSASWGTLTWTELSDVTVPGEPSAFDPIKNIAWASTIATTYAPDAMLEQIKVNPATSGGTVDLRAGPQASVGYDFWSKSRSDGLMLEISRPSDAGATAPTVRVYVSHSSTPLTHLPVSDPTCGLAAAYSAAHASLAQADPRSSRNALLTANGGTPHWWFSFAVAGKGVEVGVDASTCAISPRK